MKALVGTGVTPVSPPYKENPPYRTTNLTPLPPDADADHAEGPGQGRSGEVEDLDDEPHQAADEERVATKTEWALMRQCLPDDMQALDSPTVARVADMLQERLDSGWTPALIHATLAGNALPQQVRRLGGLVVTRLRAIPVDGAPTPRTLAGAQPRSTPSEPVGFHPAWMVERCRARLAGDPSADRPALWWAQQILGPSTIPADQSIETALSIPVQQGSLR